MNKLTPFLLGVLFLVSSAATCAESTDKRININDKDIPEPIKCYVLLGDVTGDKEMTVGLAVQLCAGTKDAKATLLCYKAAFTALGLSRGLAVELCSDGRKLK